jgi:fatty-acyl-CoA synthase
MVNRVAAGLAGLGVRKGTHVAMMVPNVPQFPLTWLAIGRLGAVMVPVNVSYTGRELDYIVNDGRAEFLVIAEEFLPTLDAMVQRPAHLVDARVIVVGHARSGMHDWQAVHDAGDPAYKASVPVGLDDLLNIQYTSGTTGFPKGATLSHSNILNNGYMVGESLGLTEHDRLVVPVPLYHCFGMVMANLGCMTHGSTLISPNDAFDPLATLRAVAEEKATALYGVPTMFIAELDHPQRGDFDLSSLRTGIMAGATCPIEVMRRVIGEMHMAEVQIAYGMTETSPVSLQTGPDDDLERRVTSVGRTQPRLESKVIDADGATVPRGEIGELCTRGYSVMLGYWNNPKATAESIDEEGWMRTGDLAVMDEQGYVRIVGRSKDMIIRGGENIYPRELEEFFFTHPAVADVQVIGVPCSKYGEEIVAWVRLHPGHTASADELREWAKARIAHFKVPRYFRFVDEFPMTVTGKVQKFRMREITLESLPER